MGSLEPSGDIGGVHDREWARLGRPGTWFTATQRVEIAAAARGGETTSPAQIAARQIYTDPAAIRRDWLADLEADGLTLAEYVEVLGIVARLRAFDTLLFGLGSAVRPLPPARSEAPPTRVRVDATINGAWVPTVGIAFPPTVLSSVPAENEAMHDVHSVLYLAPTPATDGHSMGNLRAARDGITRPQMEFIAARTSQLNDCFF
ncbi:MAG: hypothetical protein HKN44_06155 [Ilumatobacter sp.]|nr:hypothetical protein [Ilumatobacter sp.]